MPVSVVDSGERRTLTSIIASVYPLTCDTTRLGARAVKNELPVSVI